ncbi:MAG: ABC transporter permease [Microcoleaceae cyanobacterium]
MGISPLSLIGLSCKSLIGNPLRSSLTTLGVFMGVAAVSGTLQVRNISRAVITQQLEQQGAPRITLFTRRNRTTRQRAELTPEDMNYLKQRLAKIQSISGLNWVGQPETVFQDSTANPEVYAVAPDYLFTFGRELIAGRDFTEADYNQYRPVAIIDQFLSNELFQSQDPLGETIYVDFRPYIVVGLLPLNQASMQPEGEVYIPITVHSAISGQRSIRAFTIRPYRLEDLEILEEQILQQIEQRFPGYTFAAWNNVNDILEQQQTLESVSTALLVVGIVALLVGGVGIANITIAAVIERTSEIGLRRAIGATQLDVLFQFVLEAAILSIMGGAIAILTVHGLTIVVAKQFELPYKFDTNNAVIALGSAVIVGVGAGFLPALRASQLDPVKALRQK